MRFWKIRLKPQKGFCFYVVIQALTSAEAVTYALARYPGCKVDAPPFPDKGPERRI